MWPCTESLRICSIIVLFSHLHPKPNLHPSCNSRQQYVTEGEKTKERKKNISGEGYCGWFCKERENRAAIRHEMRDGGEPHSQPPAPYLRSRARASAHWAAGWGEWCCRSRGAGCTLSHSRCFSSGVRRPKEIIPHALLSKSHRRALQPRQSMHSAWTAHISITFPATAPSPSFYTPVFLVTASSHCYLL